MRQANNAIKGYLYQFNKSILEILNADEDASITLEGVIEDGTILIGERSESIRAAMTALSSIMNSHLLRTY